MFLLSNKFYIVFVSIWIIGLYFILTAFHLSPKNDKTSDDRTKSLQDEVNALQEKIAQIQSRKNDRCEEMKEELNRVKRQLREKDGRKFVSKRRNI